MRVLVTGGAGYIGSRIVAQLLQSQHDVVVVDTMAYGGDALLSFLDVGERLQIIKDDITTMNFSWVKAWGPEVVLHLAALVGEPACSQHPEQAQLVNVRGTERLLDLVTPHVRFVLFSTCSNYGVREAGELVTEVSDLRATGIYSETKIVAERLVMKHDPHNVVLRLGTVVGLSARPRFDTLVNELVHTAYHRGAIEIFQPEAWRPVLHMVDLLRVVISIIWQHASPVGIYNIIGENVTKAQVAAEITTALPQTEVRTVATSPDLRSYRVAAPRMIYELGLRPTITLTDMVSQLVTAMPLLANPNLPTYANVKAS